MTVASASVLAFIEPDPASCKADFTVGVPVQAGWQLANWCAPVHRRRSGGRPVSSLRLQVI